MSLNFRTARPVSKARAFGVTLIELMVTLLLGLLVTGAAVGIFISNKRAYAATESLGRVQEGARVAFELMARDVREAAGNPCSRNIPMANVLNPSTNWFATMGSGVTGYNGTTAMPSKAFGTGNKARVTGTDAIELRGGASSGISIKTHNGPSASLEMSTKDHGLNEGDIILVCDFKQAAITQITNASPGTNDTVVHNEGNSVSPGNAEKCLNTPAVSPCNAGNAYNYGKNSVVVKMRASRWYVGVCQNTRQCLFQSGVRNDGGALVTDDNEIIDGVKDMKLVYLLDNGSTYIPAATGTDWSKVQAVRITIDLEDKDKVGTAGEKLARTLSHVVTLRNRVE